MTEFEWLRPWEVAAAFRCHESTVRERVNDRSRADAFPAHLIDRNGHGIRIHPSVVYPVQIDSELNSGDQSAEVAILREKVQMLEDRLAAIHELSREGRFDLPTRRSDRRG
jgi:hypothetical protein